MAKGRKRLLVIAVDSEVFARFPPLLGREIFEVSMPADPRVALEAIGQTTFDLIITAFPLQTKDFQDFLDAVRAFGSPNRGAAVLAVTAPPLVDEAAAFVGKGLNKVVSWQDPNRVIEASASDLLHVAPRAAFRLNADLQVAVRSASRRLLAQTLNISRSGMLITSPGKLEIGMALEFRLELPGQSKQACGRGEVVRVDTRVKKTGAGIGIRFIEFNDDADRQRLGAFIDQQLGSAASPD